MREPASWGAACRIPSYHNRRAGKDFPASVINSMLLVFQGSRNERFKQRMRIGRTGFQFRMELDPNIPRMFAFRQFDNFRQFAVRQRPSLNQSMGEEFFLKVVVDFIAMTMRSLMRSVP